MNDTNNIKTSEIVIVAPVNDVPLRLRYEATVNLSFEHAPANKEDVTLIWLDKSINSTTDGQRTATMFREVVNCFEPFTEVELCIKFIEKIEKEKVLFVVSGAFSREVIPCVQPLKQVAYIYIFCAHPDRYQDLLDKDHTEQSKNKISGIYSERAPLKEKIRQDAKTLCRDLSTFSVFKSEKTVRDLSRESATFLWFQLLSNTLKQMPFDAKEAENEMLALCETEYYKNDSVIADINEFRQTYSPDKAIYWYSQEGFAYKLTNKALRTEDTRMLYVFRFFITDVSKQLAELYKEQLKKTSLPKCVFRGINLQLNVVNQFKENGLISHNGFMSTSLDRNEALKFLVEPSKQANPVRVLFEIDIANPTHCICADISELCVFKDEKEVLFDIGAAFRIDNIKQDVEYDVKRDDNSTISLRVWHINISVTDEGSKTKDDYLALVNKELEHTSESVVFGQLLLDMGNYVMAKEYFLKLCQKLPKDDPMMGIIHYNLGRADFYAKDLGSALGFFNDALKYQEKESSTHLVFTLIGIGQVCERNGQRPEAKDFYMQALEQCESKLGGHNCRSAAITFSALGSHYIEELQFDNALECYNTSLEIYKCLKLPNNHPDIASIECNIGDVSRRKTDWDTALKQYEKSLQIFRETLPDDHPSVAYCLSLIGLLHLQKNEVDLARKHFQDALDKYKQNGLPDNHKNIQYSIHNLTRVSYEEALKDYQK